MKVTRSIRAKKRHLSGSRTSSTTSAPMRAAALTMLSALAASGAVFAQTNAARAPHQMRPEHDLRNYEVVETLPGMDRVRVAPEIVYKTADGVVLQMQLVYPADAPGGGRGSAARPAVIFVNGVGDWPNEPKLRTWGQYRSWPRLAAASGFIAITFDARSGDESKTAEDVRDAFAYVRDKGPGLGIDTARLAAWACSANVRPTVALLLPAGAGGPAVRSAVFYYGSGEAATVRNDLPVLLVRSGRDRADGNAAIDRLAAQAASANAPWTVINLTGAHHAFDVLDDTDESRAAIRRTLSFLHDTLDPPPARAGAAPSEARVALAHFFGREYAEAETAYTAYVGRHPDDADAWTLLGNAQVELKKPDAASTSLRKAIEIDPGIAEAWSLLGRIENDKKNYVEATRLLAEAVSLQPDDGEARFQLGKAQLAQHRTAEAVTTLERAVEISPGNGWAWNSLAFAYMEAKQPAKAATSFERVLAFAPHSAPLLYNTACAHALAGNKDKAIEMLDRAVTDGYKDKAGMTADPDLASIRSDPRYLEIVKKLG